MRYFHYCDRCEEYVFSQTCNCIKYKCQIDGIHDLDDHEDSISVYTKTPEKAAEKAAEKEYHNDPYDIKFDPDDNDSINVIVLDHGIYSVIPSLEIKWESEKI